ncbi:hypothetical protein AC1031_010954 [Aphanomyces cochlioides]|nr:hypothetical protein AC1031_010954 [Aphanomyces cochlioides]
MASGNQVGPLRQQCWVSNLSPRGRSQLQIVQVNKEFTFDVDVSQLPCGMNAALYFVQMEKDGGVSKCPHDIKFINGEANVKKWTASGGGAYDSCCLEMDIWESNSNSQAYMSHPCRITGQYHCTNPVECGDTTRYSGVCDKDGCDFNPCRMNNHTFYGPGTKFAVDSSKPVTVVTQWKTPKNNTDTNKRQHRMHIY